MVKCLINSSINTENNSIFSDRRKSNTPVQFDRRGGGVNGIAGDDRRHTDRRQVNIPVENDRRTSERRGVNGATVSFENDRRNRTERRQVERPVEQDRRKGDRRQLSAQINDNSNAQSSQRGDIFFEACEALPPLRRIKALPDQIENGNGTTALGMASLALINLPEDLRDIGQSIEQIKCLYKGKEFKGSYDYKNYQHPFSFFRGTMLHKWLLKNIDKKGKWALWLADNDISLDNTSLGKKLLKTLKIEKNDEVETNIKNLSGFNENAIKHSGSYFGKLTARTMRRTTLLGLTAMGLLEVPKIIHSMTKGDTVKEKAVSTGKQWIKSAVNVASITAGIGYMGALGAKYAGPTGSIVGMGLGAVLGSKLSQKAQRNIN